MAPRDTDAQREREIAGRRMRQRVGLVQVKRHSI